MTQANDSIAVTPGTGAVVATHTVAGKEHQVMMLANQAGDIDPVLPVSDNGGSLTVDGTVAVSNLPASQAVTGTFWQATQPVSGTVAATQSGSWVVDDVPSHNGITSVSSARTATGNSGAISLVGTPRKIMVTVNMGTVSGTTPTLLFSVNQNDANGNLMRLAATASHTPITGGTQYLFMIGDGISTYTSGVAPTVAVSSISTAPAVLNPTGSIQINWTIGGTTPSFTFQYAVQCTY